MGLVQALTRWRIALGFAFGFVVFWLATPTWGSLAIGAIVAGFGEAIRLWAAGHLEKSREVTRSGPYRWTRHPLYLGSVIIAVGLAVASDRVLVAALIALYVATTIPAAMFSEERHLRAKFGPAYDAYASREAPPMERRFSFARARTNREHHTIAGVMIALALLALKVQLSIR